MGSTLSHGSKNQIPEMSPVLRSQTGDAPTQEGNTVDAMTVTEVKRELKLRGVKDSDVLREKLKELRDAETRNAPIGNTLESEE